MSTNTNDLIAAFLAKGGKVTKAAEGAGLGLTDRQWYNKTTDVSVAPRYTAEQHAEQRMEQVREAALMGGTAAVNEILGY